jgi:hypothetical protein
MGRKGRPAQTDDAAVADGGGNIFRLHGQAGVQGPRAAVQGVPQVPAGQLFSLGLDHDSLQMTAIGQGRHLRLFNHAGYG